MCASTVWLCRVVVMGLQLWLFRDDPVIDFTGGELECIVPRWGGGSGRKFHTKPRLYASLFNITYGFSRIVLLLIKDIVTYFVNMFVSTD